MFSHIRTRQQDRAEVETFDITVFDEQGQVLAEIEGFAMRRIADSGKAMEQSSVRADAKAAADQVIEIANRPGISPQAGAKALLHILNSTAPAALVAVPEAIAPADLGEAAQNIPAPAPQATVAAVRRPRRHSGFQQH